MLEQAKKKEDFIGIDSDIIKTVMLLRADNDIEYVRQSSRTKEEYKKLATNIMETVKDTNNIVSMEYIGNVVSGWMKDDAENMWKNEVRDFCVCHNDIESAYMIKQKNDTEFVIVMDDSTNDSVLDYNEFGFEILSKYKDKLSDFMVLDVNTSKGMDELYEEVKIIYKRGN